MNEIVYKEDVIRTIERYERYFSRELPTLKVMIDELSDIQEVYQEVYSWVYKPGVSAHYQCPRCKENVNWYNNFCPNCGLKRVNKDD